MIYDEMEDRANPADERAEAWEFWHERANKLEVENHQLREALKWVLPIAEIGLEDCRRERLRCGHTFGSKRIGLHDFEVSAMESAKSTLKTAERTP